MQTSVILLRASMNQEKYRDPSGKGFADFLVKVSSKNIPVMTHWEFYAWERDWPKFSKLFLDFPNQKFIIPHMGFGSPKQAKLVLSTHDNVYMTISKKNKKKETSVILLNNPN